MSLKQLKASLALWRGRYAYRAARLKVWKRLHNAKGIAKWTKLCAEAKASIHQRIQQIKEAEAPKTVRMYDSVDLNEFPPNPEAVAGYVGGKWPTYAPLVKKFPKAHHLSIAVNAAEDAI